MFTGCWHQLRPMTMTARELEATGILSLPLTDASAKMGTGIPTERPEGTAIPILADLLPIQSTMGTLIPYPSLSPDVTLPGHIKSYRFGGCSEGA